MLVYCNIYGGCIYIAICRIKPLEIEVQSVLLTKEGFGDFLDANTMIVDLFTAIIAPAFVGITITNKINGASASNSWMTGLTSALLLIQGILLIFGLQVKRVDFDWSSAKNTTMPKVAKWCIDISMILLPAIIFIFASVGAITLDHVVPFLALTICS